MTVDDTSFRVELTHIGHGWRRMVLRSPSQSYTFEFSDTPYDSIGELVDALLTTCSVYGSEAKAKFNGEPERYELELTPHALRAVRFDVSDQRRRDEGRAAA